MQEDPHFEVSDTVKPSQKTKIDTRWAEYKQSTISTHKTVLMKPIMLYAN